MGCSTWAYSAIREPTWAYPWKPICPRKVRTFLFCSTFCKEQGADPAGHSTIFRGLEIIQQPPKVSWCETNFTDCINKQLCKQYMLLLLKQGWKLFLYNSLCKALAAEPHTCVRICVLCVCPKTRFYPVPSPTWRSLTRCKLASAPWPVWCCICAACKPSSTPNKDNTAPASLAPWVPPTCMVNTHSTRVCVSVRAQACTCIAVPACFELNRSSARPCLCSLKLFNFRVSGDSPSPALPPPCLPSLSPPYSTKPCSYANILIWPILSWTWNLQGLLQGDLEAHWAADLTLYAWSILLTYLSHRPAPNSTLQH